MLYRITRVQDGCDRKNQQEYFIEALNPLLAITSFYKQFPEYARENIELEEVKN